MTGRTIRAVVNKVEVDDYLHSMIRVHWRGAGAGFHEGTLYLDPWDQIPAVGQTIHINLAWGYDS